MTSFNQKHETLCENLHKQKVLGLLFLVALPFQGCAIGLNITVLDTGIEEEKGLSSIDDSNSSNGYPSSEPSGNNSNNTNVPLALIEKGLPVVCIIPSGPLFHKTVSNIQEVIARGGKILMITDDSSLQSESENIWKIFRLPNVDPILETLIYTIPIQMLAYYTAVELGNDVDQPRNLAKSVTVE